jgi:hypothetical protein
MKFSDVAVVADSVAVEIDETFTACERKTPIFNIVLAASNSNAKTNPETKFLLTIFKFISDDCGFNDNDNNSLIFFFRR